MNVAAVGLSLAIILGAGFLIGNLLLFPVLHRGVGMQPHQAVRLAHTLALVLGWVAAGWLVPMTSGQIYFWEAESQMTAFAVLGVSSVWLLVVWLVAPGPNPTATSG